MAIKVVMKHWMRWRMLIVGALLGLGLALNLLAVKQLLHQRSQVFSSTPSISQTSPSQTASGVLEPKTNPLLVNKSSLPVQNSFQTSLPTDSPQKALPKIMYGHFLYGEGNSKQLMVIASYAQGEYQRFERLAPEAAFALMKLIYAARDAGVWIVPVSGFRSVADQTILFTKQIERRGSPEAAAKVSAPPGYSEHHTGYAIDLTDGLFPKNDISMEFEKTRAYQWLTLHARQFGFEMSFRENNSQGISYEPWHWRYIGSPTAEAIFASARKQP